MRRIEGMVLVNASLADCWDEWIQPERFPGYMGRVAKVNKRQVHIDIALQRAGVIDGTEWCFEIRGPLGKTYVTRAFLNYLEVRKCLSWATLEGEEDLDFKTSGTVNFLTPQGAVEQTLIEVTMTNSPCGLLGDLFSDVTGYGENLLMECLEDFKVHTENRSRLKRDLGIQRSSYPAL